MKEFNRLTDCVKCKRIIDEKKVKLKKVIVGPDTYRHYDALNDPKLKFEKMCTDCFYGVTPK
jgi:hypothetical protein